MLVSSHLDRAKIKHGVITGIYMESRAFTPMLLDTKTMIVPVISETVSKSIIVDLTDYRYGLSKL